MEDLLYFNFLKKFRFPHLWGKDHTVLIFVGVKTFNWIVQQNKYCHLNKIIALYTRVGRRTKIYFTKKLRSLFKSTVRLSPLLDLYRKFNFMFNDGHKSTTGKQTALFLVVKLEVSFQYSVQNMTKAAMHWVGTAKSWPTESQMFWHLTSIWFKYLSLIVLRIFGVFQKVFSLIIKKCYKWTFGQSRLSGDSGVH